MLVSTVANNNYINPNEIVIYICNLTKDKEEDDASTSSMFAIHLFSIECMLNCHILGSNN